MRINIPIINITNVSILYDTFIAISNAELLINSHDFIGVIGPNGGGKTSLIKAILGTVDYSGSITYNHITQSSIGYLPQINNFDKKFPINITDVILSGLQSNKFWRRHSPDDMNKAYDLMSEAGIIDIAKKTVTEVSGGQLQRALLCRALISNPALLILDEPANFVDNKFEKELYDLLKVLNQRMAIIMVSHDIGTITSVVKSIVCVNKTVHRHDSNIITAEQLANYNCPIQLICHGNVPHTVLKNH